MKKDPLTKDITGKMILLGTGTSVGVPAMGCRCTVCTSADPKNYRTRCSVIMGLPQGNLLIDTAPDLRQQLLREEIGIVHSVAYTHEHSDHVMGFDDLRLFQFYLGHPVPIFCTSVVQHRLEKAFDYAFSGKITTHPGATPSVDIHLIEPSTPFNVLGGTLTPVPLQHGPNFEVLGFRVGNVAYCTDVSHIPPTSMDLLTGLDVLVLDALRPDPHVTHFNIEQALEIVEKLHPKQTYFTHCSCSMNYKTVDPMLPEGVIVGWDGLQIDLT